MALKVLKTKKIVIKRKKEEECLNTFTKDISESLNDINNYSSFGIILVYGSSLPINEFKKDILYFNVTRILLKDKKYYYVSSNKNIYETLESIFNINNDNIENLKTIQIENKILIYVCVIKNFNKVKIIEGFSWLSLIDAYNLSSNKFDFTTKIYSSILNNEFRFNLHLQKLLYSENYENQIKLSDVYKFLI